MVAKKKEDEEPSDRELLWEIHAAIYGNEKSDQEGLVQKVKKHQAYIERDKKVKLIGFGAILGLNGLWEIIKSKIGL